MENTVLAKRNFKEKKIVKKVSCELQPLTSKKKKFRCCVLYLFLSLQYTLPECILPLQAIDYF